MNAVQTLCTIASCQGHLDGKPPSVYFKAPVHVAAMIVNEWPINIDDIEFEISQDVPF